MRLQRQAMAFITEGLAGETREMLSFWKICTDDNEQNKGSSDQNFKKI